MRPEDTPRPGFYRRVGKRLFDLIVTIPVLILSLPVLLVAALAVRVSLGSPVLFRQPRPGLDGTTFTIAKLRTMTSERGADGKLVPDAQRLTRLGRWLRHTSIDEIPELWNVVRGDMSLVGPRPLRVHYLDRYTREQARRHEVRPGVTGWAQVNGRNALDWQDRFAMDVWYVDNLSFSLDLRILVRTVGAVLRRDGIAAEGSVTAHEFLGDQQAPANPAPPASA